MDLREGQNITRPPLLEGNKYGYWRVRMKAFLKSQDESVWEAVEQGWTHPVATDEEGKVNLLAKDKWTEVQKKAEAANSKAMNAIFSGVDGKNFKMISTCEIAKTAWDILRTAHEGTTKVKISRMETVTSKFENLRMQEDETIADFNTRMRLFMSSLLFIILLFTALLLFIIIVLFTILLFIIIMSRSSSSYYCS
ncbi:unnamed protein product [Rhodiola kirilowii]